MIARPLDLASRLKEAPRDWDCLFFVNLGLLALFFLLFGSRFVLAPGLGSDFRMPQSPMARAGASITTHVISLKRGGLVYTHLGQQNLIQFKQWLAVAAKEVREPVLLIRADEGVEMRDLAGIYDAAAQAGFLRVIWAAEPSQPAEVR